GPVRLRPVRPTGFRLQPRHLLRRRRHRRFPSHAPSPESLRRTESEIRPVGNPAQTCLEPDSKGYVLAVRLIARWMAARVTKAARVSARFSSSFARRRFRPNQGKVRSPPQRRGDTTKPFLSSDRLTISMRRLGILARASVTWRAL